MSDLIERYFDSREKVSPDEVFVPWWFEDNTGLKKVIDPLGLAEEVVVPQWPHDLLTWDQAVDRVTQAAFGRINWRALVRSQRRVASFHGQCAERVADLMAKGERWPTSDAIARLHRRATWAWHHRHALTKTALVWAKRTEDVATLLVRMGAVGKIPDAVVILLDGSLHGVCSPAWSSDANWRNHQRDKQFSPGGDRLAELGTLCVPRATVDRWCQALQSEASITTERMTTVLLGTKRPDQSWKEFAAEHPWVPTKNGRIGRTEARRLAAIAEPWSSSEELEKTARKIETSVNR